MTKRNTRRTFMKTTAAATAGYWVAGGVQPKKSRAAIDEINFACVGVQGKGKSDSDNAARAGNIVAICDIDEKSIAKRQADDAFTGSKVYYDYRKMFDEMGKTIDAVTVSTPDHTHGVIAAAAMRNNAAVYCQKPLTRTIWEARRLAEIATETGVVTQMGNQGCQESGLREAAAKIKAGVIGTVKEVHVWTNRPVWPQGMPRPSGEPVPEHIHWDEFIGPSEMREYSAQYHPFKWRGFWAFGTGALGDMACHTLNMPFAGCDLINPVSVQATTGGHNSETFPGSSEITFEFAELESRPPLTFKWYDGGRRVDPEWLEGKEMKGSGCLVIGDKGKIYSPDDYGAEYYLLGDCEDKAVDFVRSPGHFREFVGGIRNGTKPWSNFEDYAGKLTEVILLGNLAVWAAGESTEDETTVSSQKLEWDQENLKVKGTDEFDSLIHPTFRDGYEI